MDKQRFLSLLGAAEALVEELAIRANESGMEDLGTQLEDALGELAAASLMLM